MILLKNAIYLAWAETRARYKKSILGPLWLTFGNLISIVGLSIVWSKLLNEDIRSFVPSVTSGLIIWQLIAGTIGEGPTTFVRQSIMIRNVAIPAWFFVIRALFRHLFNLFHNLIILVGIVLYFELPLTNATWLALPGLVLIILNLFWIMYILGILGARFRDLEYLINTFLPILFFISPVIFRPERLPISMDIIKLNPFSHFIEVVREPFLGNLPNIYSFPIVGGMLLLGSAMTLLLHHLRGRRLAFWV